MAEGTNQLKKEELNIFKQLTSLFKIIRRHSLGPPNPQGRDLIFHHCCQTLNSFLDCALIWAGEIDGNKHQLSVFATSSTATTQQAATQQHLAEMLTDQFSWSLQGFTEPIFLYLDAEESDPNTTEQHYCLIWPIIYRTHRYGFLTFHCRAKDTICSLNQDLIGSVMDEIALALYSQENAFILQDERDFNREIIDTIQALMVTISPCGMIISFNKKAHEVTGYTEAETVGKYWVDVLIAPDNRKKYQQLFSTTLKEAEKSLNFTAPLLCKKGFEHSINWHGSIRHNIDTGTVGLVMIGIDETDSIAVDHQLHHITARWEKIFNAIHDPVLVVSNDNIILDANPAACAAAKKRKVEVVGKKVCDIVHGGHAYNDPCQLEQFIGYQKTRITETNLPGLHGIYMLTVSPLLEENGEVNATLLVARNLTEEEVVRAEAIRVSQLAAIGELASGVAHEINNPINTIINYAQIILDDPKDTDATRNLDNIINEGKRIAKIISNLLRFGRGGEEQHSSAQIENIISNSIQLVTHLLKTDGIRWTVEVGSPVPPLLCREHQLQQVFLNLISNARYALNKKFPQPCPEKQLLISINYINHPGTEYIRIQFKDFGIGIAKDIQTRLFDPFFSTKPKGKGTGLGLSVSYGLVKEHGGTITVDSQQGEQTTFTIDLPVSTCYD